MYIRFKENPLKLMKENGWSQTRLRNEKIFGCSTMARLKDLNTKVSIETLGKVAYYANVNITDIVEVVKEEREEDYDD